MWEHINSDVFLYKDATYTYSLTKYVEKNLFTGPQSQKQDILSLLRKKQALDRFWAHDILVTQPDDYCNGPPHIEEEVVTQKKRQKRMSEMREDAVHMLDLKRMTAIKEVEIHDITAQGEIQITKEKARVERELLREKATMQLQIAENAFHQSSRHVSNRQQSELSHQKALEDAKVHSARLLMQEETESERSKNMMQIEYLHNKIEIENVGHRQRLAIEEQAADNMDRVNARGHDRELARMKMQKQLLGQQQQLAGSSLGGPWSGQRQIGFVSDLD
jgi:hypothetical protein